VSPSSLTNVGRGIKTDEGVGGKKGHRKFIKIRRPGQKIRTGSTVRNRAGARDQGTSKKGRGYSRTKYGTGRKKKMIGQKKGEGKGRRASGPRNRENLYTTSPNKETMVICSGGTTGGGPLPLIREETTHTHQNTKTKNKKEKKKKNTKLSRRQQEELGGNRINGPPTWSHPFVKEGGIESGGFERRLTTKKTFGGSCHSRTN